MAQPALSLYFTASRQGPRELEAFAEEAAASDLPGSALFSEVRLNRWAAAPGLLAAALLAHQAVIVIIDEFPHLVDHDPSIEATPQKQWDRLLSRKPVLLILIGSDLAMMESLGSHDRPFSQRGTEMGVPPLSPVETASVVGSLDAADAFDAFGDPTSALIVSAERSLAAELWGVSSTWSGLNVNAGQGPCRSVQRTTVGAVSTSP